MSSEAEEGSFDTAVAEFRAWLWVPPLFRVRARGFPTVRLAVFPHRLAVTPLFKSAVTAFVLGIPPSIEYDWPAVVIEQLLPIRGQGILLDVNAALGRVSVPWWQSRRLAESVREAGFGVVEVSRWGWEAPRTIRRTELGEYDDQVPDCIIEG